MHKIIIIGHLGRDPEMRYTPSGDGVTSFSVASSRRYRTAAGEQREETMWFNVSAWGRLAETCNQYLTKGRQVYLEGTLSNRIFQGNDGQPRISNDVRLIDVQFLSQPSSGMGDDQGRSSYGGNEGSRGMDDAGGGYRGGQGAGADSGGGYGGYGGPNDDIDDLPF